MKKLLLALCLSTLAAAPALADMRDNMRGGMGGGMGGHHGGDFGHGGRGDNRGGDWRGGRRGDWRGGRDDHRGGHHGGGGWNGGRDDHRGGGRDWRDDRGRGSQLTGISQRGAGYYYGNLDCQTAIYYFTGLSQGRPIQGSWYQGGDQPVRVLNQISCGWGLTNSYMQVQGLDNGGIFVMRADDFRAF